MTSPVAPPLPLSRLMREGSQAEHTEAEGSSFMAALLDGRVAPAGYAAYLSAYAPVYAALERVGRTLADTGSPDPIAAAVWDPRLERGAALDSDLRAFGLDPAAVSAAPPLAAVRAYVDRLDEAAAWGGLFVAHHYTRYLGDLSGGQAIGRIIARTYGLEDGDGTAFYRFGAIGKSKPYKDSYRARLDALHLDAVDASRVLEEVRVAFRLNQAIFAELGEDLPRHLRAD